MNALPHAERLGGATTADGTTGATIHRQWMVVRSVLSGQDDCAIVSEVRRGDSLTVAAVLSTHTRFDQLQQVAQ